MDTPDAGELEIRDLDFQGSYVSSPSGTWHLAAEIATGENPVVRWALVRNAVVRSTGSTSTHEIFTMAVADDATFLLARRKGRVETVVEIRDASGEILVTSSIEAIAHSSTISPSGRWVAVGFSESKRGDDPVLLIDADKHRVYRRIPASGGTVRSIDEARRVVVTDDGEFEFGTEAAAPTQRGAGPSEAAAPVWNPADPYEPPRESRGFSTWSMFSLGAGIVIAIFVGWILVSGVFFAAAPAALRKAETNMVHQIGKDAVQEYEMTRRHGTPRDLCRAAADVAEFYLRTHNENEYGHWKAVEKRDCDAAH
jgi:hypothetical protein